jgi:deoxyadenosine/deoxycytidine kinase
MTWYEYIFEKLIKDIKTPDLVVFLDGSVSTLKEWINKRGWDYEMAMSNEYLA